MPRLRWMSLLLAVVCVIAASTLLVWYELRNGPITAALANDLQTLVRQQPHLQPMYELALNDGRITLTEADAIIKAAETASSHK